VVFQLVVSLQKVPDNLFYKVTMVRDIRQAIMLNKNQVKRGEPDVVLVSPLGHQERITRNDLLKRFITPDGKRIKIGYWRYGRRYLVIENCDYKMGAFKVPRSSKFKITLPDGKSVNHGNYLVCPMTKEGDILKNRAIIVKPEVFNRMFRIDKKPSLRDNLFKQAILKKEVGHTGVKSVINQAVNNNVEIKKANNIGKNETVAKFEAIKRIVRPDNGKIVGFVITDGKESRNLTVLQVMDLCRHKKIRNLTIVEANGKEFLRGVGIRIENLPAIVMK